MSTRVYNLADDDPNLPKLEETLGRIESAYAPLLIRLIDGHEPTQEEWMALCGFLGTLRARTVQDMSHWETQLGELERMHRMVERAHTGSEQSSDERFPPGGQFSLRLMLTRADAYAEVVAEGGWLFHNNSRLPLISSDTPVIHPFLHGDELLSLGLPADWLAKDLRRSERGFVSYAALSPTLGFLSSPLLSPPADSMYRSSTEERVALGLNHLMRVNATSTLISSNPKPLGEWQEALLAREAAFLARPTPPHTLVIYTSNDRYRIDVIGHSIAEGTTPLDSGIHVRTADRAAMTQLASEGLITELRLYDGTTMIHEMRQCRVTSLPPGDSDEYTIRLSL